MAATSLWQHSRIPSGLAITCRRVWLCTQKLNDSRPCAWTGQAYSNVYFHLKLPKDPDIRSRFLHFGQYGDSGSCSTVGAV